MAGVSILDNLHVVDQLCFGSEYGEVSALQELAAVLVKEPKEYRVLLKTFERRAVFPRQKPGADRIFPKILIILRETILMVF